MESGYRTEARDQGLQQVEARERVAGALHEQHGDAHRGQVAVAQRFGSARRVQRVAEEQEPVGGRGRTVEAFAWEEAPSDPGASLLSAPR